MRTIGSDLGHSAGFCKTCAACDRNPATSCDAMHAALSFFEVDRCCVSRADLAHQPSEPPSYVDQPRPRAMTRHCLSGARQASSTSFPNYAHAQHVPVRYHKGLNTFRTGRLCPKRPFEGPWKLRRRPEMEWRSFDTPRRRPDVQKHSMLVS